MYPLIEIKTVPIEIEMKVTHAKMEYSRGTAELEISRGEGGMSIKSRPIRLNIAWRMPFCPFFSRRIPMFWLSSFRISIFSSCKACRLPPLRLRSSARPALRTVYFPPRGSLSV